MRTITYNDEAAPWSSGNHVLGTRSLLSSNDSNNNGYGNLKEQMR
jgi:hypothetical protein